MSRSGRKPWETPIEYVEDRFVEPKRVDAPESREISRGASDNGDVRDERDIEEILRRPDRKEEEREYECNDVTPINYKKGPHDEEFGVEDHDFDDGADNPPLDYQQGPHDEEFGVEDEDEELEPVDDIPEFDEEV